MYVRACKTEQLPGPAARRLLEVAVLVAGAMLASAWLRATGSAGLGVAVLAAGGMLGAWLLNHHARLRGLPLAAGTIMTAVAIVAWAVGGELDGVPPGGSLFVALLLSMYPRSWTVGILATLLLAGAEIVAQLT